MTEKEARDLLKFWGMSLSICEKKQDEINRLKNLINYDICISSPKIDGMPKSNTKISTVENTAIKLAEVYNKVIERLTDEIKKTLDKKEQISRIINKFDFEHQRVIELKYIDNCSWSSICKNLHISRSKCFCMHNNVLEALRQVWTFVD